MKKFRIFLILVLCISFTPIRADEGMWLLPLLKQMNASKMKELGFTITPDQIYSISHTSIKDAIVIFGNGCTGEIVSNKGLVFTNHHCGYSAIQKLSSVEHNYLKNGYWAMNSKEELPAEGLKVTFLVSFNDVTSQINGINAKGEKIKKESRRKSYLFKNTENLKKEFIGTNKNCKAMIQPFYGGNKYYLMVYKIYKDIRFVGAPPSSIGKFGADTDNWMWPRHTGDFSVFRVYADAQNEPAAYSKNNVPYTPKQSLKISLKGIKKNDPTMIMGYPGGTNRFMTNSELLETRDINNATIIKLRGIRQDILMADMEADPKVRIQYSNKYANSSNGWKKFIGMNETFVKLNVAQRRLDEEKNFTEWVNQDPKRVEKYSKTLAKIDTAIINRRDELRTYLYFSQSLGEIELSRIAGTINMDLKKLAKTKKEKNQETLKSIIIEKLNTFYKDYNLPTDKKVAVAMLKIFAEDMVPENYPSIYKTIKEKFNNDYSAYVDDMFSNSLFTDKEKIESFVNNFTKDQLDFLKTDPAIEFSSSLMPLIMKIGMSMRKYTPLLKEGKKEYIAGTLEMRKGESIYPDANFTMRLTYGQVLPYSPRDAVYYDYYTTLTGVMEKEDPNNWEFIVPVRLKELWKNKNFGQYGMKNGKMPVAFLTNNDITGGNSGSPVMNGNGELIGLAFDGNWESMSSDIIFEPNLQRCICVDIRYVLFIMDKYGKASYLLDEMNLVKN
ncbi:MAG: S46 family peptidase [Bacteroidales bacterium]